MWFISSELNRGVKRTKSVQAWRGDVGFPVTTTSWWDLCKKWVELCLGLASLCVRGHAEAEGSAWPAVPLDDTVRGLRRSQQILQIDSVAARLTRSLWLRNAETNLCRRATSGVYGRKAHRQGSVSILLMAVKQYFV